MTTLITDAMRVNAARFAIAQKGKPYTTVVKDAAGPAAFDCSGLTMAAWGASGVALPHNSTQQCQPWNNPVGRFVPWSPDMWRLAKIGDLVPFYPPDLSHIAMYVGNDQHGKFLLAQATDTEHGCEVIPWDKYAAPCGLVFMGHL